MDLTPRTNRPELAGEQLTRTWRSFLALGFGNYGAMVIGLVVNALLARQLGTEQYGRLALLLMASQVLLLIAVNWSHAGFVRFGAMEFAARGAVAETLWARMGIVWPAAAIGAAAMVIGREPLAAYLAIPEAGVWLLLGHFIAACALSMVGAVFQARDQMARYGVCLFLDKSVMLLCVVLLPAAWTGSALTVLACYAASSLSVAIWGASVVGLRALRPTWPRAAYRQMVVFSVPLLLTTWAGLFGTNWFDLAILKLYVPLSEIGVYSLGAQLAGVIQQITVIVSTLLLPELSVMVLEGRHARIRTLVERLLPYYLLCTSILFSVVLIAAPIGIPLVFGVPYSGTAPILAMLMLASCALAIFNACTPLVSAYGSTWVLTGIAFASTAVNVVMNLVLIPRYGISGSALATVMAYGTGAVLVLSFVQKKTGGRVWRLGWLAAPALVTYATSLLVDGLWFYPAALGLGAITVVTLVGAFGLFCAEDAVFLKGLQVKVPFGLGAGTPTAPRL